MAVLPLCVVPPVLSRVAVVMGSDSDLPTMEPAAAILRELGVEVEVRVLSAHRTPLEMVNFAQAARGQGCLLYTSPSPRDGLLSRMPSSA